jgi:hypothetical protein
MSYTKKKIDYELRVVAPKCCHSGLYVKVPVTMTSFCSNKAQRDEISHGETAKAPLSIVTEGFIVTRVLGRVYASSASR